MWYQILGVYVHLNNLFKLNLQRAEEDRGQVSRRSESTILYDFGKDGENSS